MRRPLVLLVALAGASAHAGEDRAPSVRIDHPAAPDVATPVPVVDLRGVATGADRLSVSIETKERTLSFQATPGVTIAMTVDVAGAIASGRVGAREQPETIRRETARVIGALLRRAGATDPVVEVGDAGLLVARLKPEDDALLLEMPAFLPASSTLEFRVQVQPSERLTSEEGLAPARATWTGTAAQFETYLAEEVARWKKARGSRQPYIPGRAGMRLVPRRGTTAEGVLDFLLVEEPEARLRFDNSWIRSVLRSEDAAGEPVLSVFLRKDKVAAMRELTESSVGHAMAILVDGEVVSAPRLLSAISDSLQISMGVGSPDARRAEAERLEVALSQNELRGRAAVVGVVAWGKRGEFDALAPLGADGMQTWTLRLRAPGDPATAVASRRVVLAPSAHLGAEDAARARATWVRIGGADPDAVAQAVMADGGDAMAVVLQDLLRAPFASARVTAARIARRFPAELAAGPLREALDDRNPSVRLAAVRSLAMLGPAAAPALTRLLDLSLDPSPAVQEAVAAALRAMADAPELLQAARSAEPGVRVQLLGAVALAVKPEVTTLVLDLLDDDDEDVRKKAGTLLASRWAFAGSDGARGEFLRRVLAATARRPEHLGALTGILADADSSSVDAVAASLSAEDEKVRVAAAAALMLDGKEAERARPILEDVRAKPDHPWQPIADAILRAEDAPK